MPFNSLNGILGPDDLDTLQRVLERAAASLPHEDKEHLAAALIALRQHGDAADEDELYACLMELAQIGRTG